VENVQWFLRLGDQRLGPVSTAELQVLVERGAVNRSTPISSDCDLWKAAETFESLGLTFPQTPAAARAVSDLFGITESNEGQARERAAINALPVAEQLPESGSQAPDKVNEGNGDDPKSGRLAGTRNAMPMSWHIRLGAQMIGPLTSEELRLLSLRGAIQPDTPVSPNETQWMTAASLPGLQFARRVSDVSTEWQITGQPAAPPLMPVSRFLDSCQAVIKSQIITLVHDFRNMDVRREIIPLNQQDLKRLTQDAGFWVVLILGIVPLLISTFADARTQLVAFAFFFAIAWGVIFKLFVIRDGGEWKTPVAGLIVTAVVGFPICVAFERIVLAEMPSSFVKVVFGVGLPEELCKIVPAVAYVLWRRSATRPLTLVLVGVFSGLGFAASENLGYDALAVDASVDLTHSYGSEGLVLGVENAMVLTLMRSMGTVFIHAVLSGTYACFIAMGLVRDRRWGAHFLLGLAVAAFIHGIYDWLLGVQPTVALFVAAGSFVLLWGYLVKLRRVMEEQSEQPRMV
jgi:RsiW-degrading membrane proteinase PrsW (M82 family)